MHDVARAAGVHQTTVSLALRNDPRLPEPTRVRLQELARKLGYTPDPMLSALNFYRSAKHAVKAPITMAFLLNLRDQRELAASMPHRLFVEGARKQAAQIGYQLELFFLGAESDARRRRIERVLAARGITGVIVGAFADGEIKFPMDWARFSAVLIESQQLGLSLHTVSNDQAMITRTAVRELSKLGYRRIGLVVGELEEIYLRNAFTSGYYVEIAQQTGLEEIPPCLLPLRHGPIVGREVARWARAHRVEAVACNWHHVSAALRAEGVRVPQDLVVAALDLMPGAAPNAGMRQNHRIVGERAVEQLAILMKTNQRGTVEAPNHTLIEGVWVEGSDVPAKQIRRVAAGRRSSRGRVIL